jgi:hypothetical protein
MTSTFGPSSERMLKDEWPVALTHRSKNRHLPKDAYQDFQLATTYPTEPSLDECQYTTQVTLVRLTRQKEDAGQLKGYSTES